MFLLSRTERHLPPTAMFCNSDEVLLLLEVMHLAKVKSDFITAAMREMPLIWLAVVASQRQGDNVALI